MFYRILTIFIFASCVSIESSAQTNNLYDFFVGKKDMDYRRLFDEVIKRVKTEYVEETSDQELYEAALDGMLSSLDPHSSFLNEKAFQDMRISTKGEFGGLGIEVTMERGFVKVISPYEDGPAFKAGIKVGDYITMIGDQIVKGLTLSQAVDKLRGKPKTEVKITIYRESTNETKEINITRDIVKIVPVKSSILANNVGHIRIASFSENTASLVEKEFNELRDKVKKDGEELKGIVLDLRWNPGGLLDQSKEVTELFLKNGTIVSTKGRVKDSNVVYKSEGQDITNGLPIVVLINGGSASASEIVAGALQDNKRALVAGTKSFGKGSVQTVIPLPGDTAIKMTTSLYYTPKGRSIQANGIDPDVLIEESIITNTNQKFFGTESSLANHLNGTNDGKAEHKQISSASNVKNVTGSEDFQLLRSVDLVKGMALYSEKLKR